MCVCKYSTKKIVVMCKKPFPEILHHRKSSDWYNNDFYLLVFQIFKAYLQWKDFASMYAYFICILINMPTWSFGKENKLETSCDTILNVNTIPFLYYYYTIHISGNFRKANIYFCDLVCFYNVGKLRNTVEVLEGKYCVINVGLYTCFHFKRMSN